jgi:hypothetical protein
MGARRVMVWMCAWSTMAAPGFAQGRSVHRVRSEKPAIAALIEEGIAGSKTFKALVAAIDQTDGLVYVEEGRCKQGVRACLAMTMALAGPHRLLRIVIDPGRSPRSLVCSVGHELQHAVEILSEPTIRSSEAIVHLYLRESPTDATRFETPAAVRAGLDVCHELGADP